MVSTAEIIGRNLTQGKDANLASLYKAWERVGQALRHVRGSPRVIVDVGCCDATGSALFRIAHPNARLIGVECVPERAELALLEEAQRPRDQAQPGAHRNSIDFVIAGAGGAEAELPDSRRDVERDVGAR